MDDAKITKKIEALTKKLARRQRKLLKWSIRKNVQKKLSNDSNNNHSDIIQRDSSEHQDHFTETMNHNAANRGIPDKVSPYTSLPECTNVSIVNNLDPFNAAPHSVRYNGKTEPTKSETDSEEELFSNDLQDIDNNLILKPCTITRGVCQNEETVVEMKITNSDCSTNGCKNVRNSLSESVGKTNYFSEEITYLDATNKTVDSNLYENVTETTSRRRSSRISLKLKANSSTPKSKKLKLDTKSVVELAFQILCQMAQDLKIEEFALPAADFIGTGYENICNEHQESQALENNVLVADFNPCANPLHCLDLAVKSKTGSSEKTDIQPNVSIIENDDCIEEAVNAGCQTITEADSICEAVLQEMVNTLDKEESLNAKSCFIQALPTNHERRDHKNYVPLSNIHSTTCLQGSSEDLVHSLVLFMANESMFAVLQKNQCISIWKDQNESWIQLNRYNVGKTEEILDMSVHHSNLVVLVRGNEISIRILNLNHEQIHLVDQVSLGSLSRCAAWGTLGGLEKEMSFSSCLHFEGQCPQIEIHTIRPGHPADTVYLKPPKENILCPAICIQGLPNGLMGLGVNKLHFWNISTGELVRTVLLSTDKESKTFEKCIWAKIEKGLLFGVFKDNISENWKLLVINPATGLYNELCQYFCPTCRGTEQYQHTKYRPLEGKVECHKLLSICSRLHFTVFDLLTAKALIASKMEDTKAISLKANVIITADMTGCVSAFKIGNV